jgi:predicted RNase H-like HicB family nuclease
MPAYTYSEFSFYSIFHDCDCIRLSVSDGKTGEYFVIVPDPGYGKSLRKAREKALSAIEAAIDADLPPGEIKVSFEEPLHAS